MLMGIRCEAVRPPAAPSPSGEAEVVPANLPVTGSHIWELGKGDADPIGAVTSSTLSPMLGSTPVCFAMIKHDLARPGVDVLVGADGDQIRGRTQDGLTFWKRA
jgi:glycine cleavage system aminomethyltransferase T